MSNSNITEALFHLSVKPIGRSASRSVLACIAYRSASLMRGENGAIVADYRRRGGVVYSKIIAPSIAPRWAFNRQSLWLNACSKELRKNSVEGREFEVAIPFGLSDSQAIALVEKFSEELVEKHKFVIDFSLHADSRTDWTGVKKNLNGYHAHIVATTRRIETDGFKEKTREFDEKSTGIINYWRRRWSELANEHLQAAGINARIDHRSHRARGIDRTPTIHLGPAIVAMERKGVKTRHGDYTRSLLKAFVLGVQAKVGEEHGAIDVVSTVSQALALRDQVKNAHHDLILKTRKLLGNFEFEGAIKELSNNLSLANSESLIPNNDRPSKLILAPK